MQWCGEAWIFELPELPRSKGTWSLEVPSVPGWEFSSDPALAAFAVKKQKISLGMQLRSALRRLRISGYMHKGQICTSALCRGNLGIITFPVVGLFPPRRTLFFHIDVDGGMEELGVGSYMLLRTVITFV